MAGEYQYFERDRARPSLMMDIGTEQRIDEARPVLEARHLTKQYVRGRWPSTRVQVTAVEDASVTLFPGSTLALVGRSGAGKSTLGRCVALLEAPDSGEIRFHGRDVLALRNSELVSIRRQIQFVFQQSATAMNPSFEVLEVVAEPLRIEAIASKKQRYERALALLEQVGIRGESVNRSPLKFSGGQRQRIAIARALILKPKLLVLDEPFSGLDLRTQMQIANILLELQASLSLSYLLISHDLRMAAYLADTMAIMEEGRIVEEGSTPDLFSYARHHQTRELIAAIPDFKEPRQIRPDTVL